MGLDMYLNAKRFLWTIEGNPDVEIANKVMALFPELKPNKKWGLEQSPVSRIIIEAFYWRKANAIHKWFVDNVQGGEDDCGNYEVAREQLSELLDTVKKVLDNHKLATELLPSQGGFFFGGTDYDEWYYKDLEMTKVGIEEALKLPEDWDFEYHSSW
jgi:hypothetical protein